MLSDYTPPSETIETSGGPITLYGLNLDDAGFLIRRHSDAATSILFTGNINTGELLLQAPLMVADIIACAAGERESGEVVAQFPAGVQARALTVIFDLTFRDIDMGELMARFAKTVENACRAIKENSRPG